MATPDSVPPTHSHGARALLLWALALSVAAVLGVWVRQEVSARGRRDGQSAVVHATHLTDTARDAEAAGNLDAAAEDSRGALELLRATEGARGGPAYATALTDLASRLARRNSAEGPEAAAKLLEEAWEVSGLSASLRGRIARDLGALALLRGELEAAQQWYERAEQEDGATSPRLDALRESARLSGPHAE